MEYRIDPKNFSKGVRYAKQFGGKFNPSTKTWTIPMTQPNGAVNNGLNAPKSYGLIPVKPVASRWNDQDDRHGDVDFDGNIGSW